MPNLSFHENYRREEAISASSNRSFGLVFSAFFAIVAGFLYWRQNPWAVALLAAAIATCATALIRPVLLALPSRLWLKFGLLLHRVISPVILFVLFAAVFVPVATVRRWLGSDPLRLARDPQADSYWIRRVPPGPRGDTLPRQF